MLAWCAVEREALETDVAIFLLRSVRKLASDGGRATTLGIIDRIHSAGFQGLGVRACLVATSVAVDKLDISVFVTQDFHVCDGGLLLWNARAARD